ncbi:MAG: helix-turn-helix transcriptional regulator [Pseudomonadota bacterium]
MSNRPRASAMRFPIIFFSRASSITTNYHAASCPTNHAMLFTKITSRDTNVQMFNQIKALREGAQLSQQALADAAGWSQSRWSNYERMIRTPDVNDARAMVLAFRSLGETVSLDDLFPIDAQGKLVA